MFAMLTSSFTLTSIFYTQLVECQIIQSETFVRGAGVGWFMCL